MWGEGGQGWKALPTSVPEIHPSLSPSCRFMQRPVLFSNLHVAGLPGARPLPSDSLRALGYLGVLTGEGVEREAQIAKDTHCYLCKF